MIRARDKLSQQRQGRGLSGGLARLQHWKKPGDGVVAYRSFSTREVSSFSVVFVLLH